MESNNTIVLINQSSGYLMVDIVNAYAEKYDQVILFTGFLNPRKEPLNKSVEVYNLKTYNRKNSASRLLTWSVFFIQSLLLLIFKYPKADLFLVSNPPLNILLGKWLNRRMSFLIYDVYPDAFVTTGLLSKSNFLVKLWEGWNRTTLKKADRVFTISMGMKQVLGNYIDENRITIVPIWTDNEFIKPIDRSENPLNTEWNCKGKFVIMYSGNIGRAHPVELILELAKEIQTVQFFIIGEGEKKEMLIQLKSKNKLENVTILPFQPTDLLPYTLTLADLAIVTLSNEAGQLSVPSKTYSLMSAGVPIMTIAPEDSELYHLIEDNNLGASFSFNQIEEMKRFILGLMTDNVRYNQLATNVLNTSKKYTSLNAKELIVK